MQAVYYTCSLCLGPCILYSYFARMNKQPEKRWNKNPFLLRIFGPAYFIKTPGWVKSLWPSYVWDIPTQDKVIYLSFDDGPHPIATPFVLDELKKYNARASFFCIGKNVAAHPDIYQRILDEGHVTGNHTYHHPNGWKTKNQLYLQDIAEAAKLIDSALFRPPYGRIRSYQARHAALAMNKDAANIIMWSVLSGDFDDSITPEQCLENVIANTGDGAIVVFHDSEKALARLKYALPRVLDFFSNEGYRFEPIRLPLKKKAVMP